LRTNKTLLLVASIGLIAALGSFPACKKSGEAAAPAKKPGTKPVMSYPVEVQPVAVQSLIFTVNAVGSVDAFEKVQVTARVAGVVDRLLFAEGNQAKLNQILVEIEPQRFKLAVDAAQASYDKAVASKADAEAGLKRREQVIVQNPGLIPGEEVETWRTKVRLAAADVAQTLSSLNQAKLNLRDAYVRAPIAGIIQTRTVQTGQYVQVGTILATLIRREPLLLRFRVPERDAAQLKSGMVANFTVRDNPTNYESKIVHVAAAADEEARMVDITAEIRGSSDQALRPGAFAEITIPVSAPRTVPVIPQTAIRPSERGFIAFVVENDMARERVLTIGMRTIDGQAEVLTGMQPGEVLVVRGAEALRDGAPVRVVESIDAIAGKDRPQAPGAKTKAPVPDAVAKDAPAKPGEKK
jgi:membrane fusion protein, multidrug efflux system